MRAKDEMTYGDGGYLTKDGQSAVDGFSDYQKKLDDLKRNYGSSLTPAQSKLFMSAVEPIQNDALRSALRHRGSALKQFVVQEATNGADSFKTQAVRTYVDPAQAQKYLAAGVAEISGLGEKLGWSPEKLRSETAAYVSDAHRLTALEMANADPIAALEYVTKNKDHLSPVDHLNLMKSLMPLVAPAATQDAVATARANPASTADSVVNRIVSAESGGNANARNPNSSAGGVGQFLDGTWLQMVRKYRPDLADGKTDRAILALKTDPDLGREMTGRYAHENAAGLRTAGFEATPGNIYLAHFLGSGDAKKALGARDETPLAELLPAAVITANPFLRGHDVGWIKSWAAGKMVGAASDSVKFSPRMTKLLSELPEGYAGRIRESVASGVTQVAAQQAAQLKAQRLEVVDIYRLRIAKEDAALTRQEILDDPVLDNGDKASLLSSYSSKFNEALETRQAVGAFQAGQLAIDPYAATGRKLVDAVWSTISTTVDKDKLQPALEELVRQGGVVPQSVVNAIRGDLTGRSPASVANAARLASRLHTVDPVALERRDGGKEVRDAAVMFSHLTDGVGMSPAAAAQRLIELRDPEKVRERAALMQSEPIKKFVKDQATESNVRDIYDPGLFGFDPKLGETPAQSAAMVGEYRDMLEESVYDAAGNQDLAKTLAADRFKRRYGVSDFAISGKGVVTRLPVEITYPAGIDGTHNYIRTQVKDALSAAGIKAKDVFLQSDTMTDQDFTAGKQARYQVWFRDEKGILDRYHLPFFAIPPSRDEVMAARKAKAERNRDLSMAREEIETDQIMKQSPFTAYPTGAF
jgi:hypothetical protein